MPVVLKITALKAIYLYCLLVTAKSVEGITQMKEETSVNSAGFPGRNASRQVLHCCLVVVVTSL